MADATPKTDDETIDSPTASEEGHESKLEQLELLKKKMEADKAMVEALEREVATSSEHYKAAAKVYDLRELLAEHLKESERKSTNLKRKLWEALRKTEQVFGKLPEPSPLKKNPKKHLNSHLFSNIWFKRLDTMRKVLEDHQFRKKFAHTKADVDGLWHMLPDEVQKEFTKLADRRMAEATKAAAES